MADNIAKILPPSTVHLCVEPVQLELEPEDGSLLFSALQSAFPHCTGVYFRAKNGSNCRVMLKFDGKRVLAPSGGWSTKTEYFVELGGGTRHTPFPFNSYEQASKQFERSVNLVQQMMNAAGTKTTSAAAGRRKVSISSAKTSSHRGRVSSIIDRDGLHEQQQHHHHDDSMALSPPSLALSPINGVGRPNYVENNNIHHNKDGLIIDDEQQRKDSFSADSVESTVPSAAATMRRDSKCLERDFADLARICAGKDTVIDGQRAELDRQMAELERLNAAEAQWTEQEAEWRAKWEAAEQELGMLRALGRDQQSLQGHILEINKRLEAERAQWAQARSELEGQVRKAQREAQAWREKSELGHLTISETAEKLKQTLREKAELAKKTAILEEQVNGEAIEFSRRFQERERVQQELLVDNTRLYQVKDELELECKELRGQLINAEEQCRKRMQEVIAEHEANKRALQNMLRECESKATGMEQKVTELTEQKAAAEELVRNLRNHSQLGNQDPPLFSYSQD